LKVNDINKAHMRNDEHFQFHTEILRTLESVSIEKLKIPILLEQYKIAFNKLDDGLKKIVKSEYTKQIHEEDKARDEVFHALTTISKGYLLHPANEKKEAARRLKIVFDTYGNIAGKPLNEQTSALHNILQDLDGQYKSDLVRLGIVDLSDALKLRNDALSVLVAKRYDELSEKTNVVVKDARIKLDAVYDEICEQIYALWRVEGEYIHEKVTISLNTIIDKYRAIMNMRVGKKNHKEEEKK